MHGQADFECRPNDASGCALTMTFSFANTLVLRFIPRPAVEGRLEYFRYSVLATLDRALDALSERSGEAVGLISAEERDYLEAVKAG